jgi:hypothetical protein
MNPKPDLSACCVFLRLEAIESLTEFIKIQGYRI